MAAIKNIKCEEVITIKDFHDKVGEWIDPKDGGLGDRIKVSCKQIKTHDSLYDELKNKFDKYYFGHYSEKQVAQAMCECCKEKSNPPKSFATLFLEDQWGSYYECMDSKGIYRHGKKPVKLFL